ncbi:MAG: A/G-specific adenine glycosylase [Burkholderiaceae bacterium]|nr:A/G-specific adenine glycosylase [Burkholderiaceae bacterium]
MAASAEFEAFAQRLIRWQRESGRHNLPWQTRPADPYRVWLSEIMLQQTQVTTVIDYFHRFVARFPSLESLAQADEQEVLALWSGLGYYQRARNLLACARRIVQDHAGQFPNSAQQLAMLPGIGPSTAAAIAATVYQERAAILDGNVKRVLARVTRAEHAWGSVALERALWQEAGRRLPQSPKDMPAYTQAIMDLGALVCRAKQPQCERCPVVSDCRAAREGVVDRYPVARAKRSVPTRVAYWAVCCDQHGVWLMQQPTSGIWPGLWLPWVIDPEDLPSGWPEMSARIQAIHAIKHSFTHYRLTISAAVLPWSELPRPSGAPEALQRFSWPAALALPLPAPVSKLLLKLCPAETKSGAAQSRNTQT